MPDTRRHRGQHPEDAELFTKNSIPALHAAIVDLSWLLTRGYSDRSALKLVGDRHELTARQRLAVQRSACSDSSLDRRVRTCASIDELHGRSIAIDGFNLLITLESALSGGAIFIGRDGCYRDLASIHGTYRTVEETEPGIILVGAVLDGYGITDVFWYLDAPVSNSGRLKSKLLEIARMYGWSWQVELLNNPDRELAVSNLPIVSSDSYILDRCSAWVNLAGLIINNCIPSAYILDLR